MSFTRDSIPDLAGKVAVVTGGNGGLGLETAKAFAAKGAHVVIAARDQGKAATAADEIRAETSDASLEVVPLDLGSLASVADAAAQIGDSHPTIDILVNNAGLMAMPEGRTADGFEMQLGVNHFGHWALTAQLMPALIAASAARVVTVTSTAHHIGRVIDPNDINLERGYKPWMAYGRSKLANHDFAIGLQRELERAGVGAQSLLAHPGLSHTDLQTRTAREGGAGRSAGLIASGTARVGMSPARGALSQIRAATDPHARGGQFYGPRFVNNGAPVRKPLLRPGTTKRIKVLWEVSERETGIPMIIG